MVPPVPERVLLLPSSPVTVTEVAFVAAMVSVELAPAVIVVGFAAMVTVGEDDPPLPACTEPQPASSRSSEHETRAISDENVEPYGRRARTFIVLVLPICR
jgi:hypothetical protein